MVFSSYNSSILMLNIFERFYNVGITRILILNTLEDASHLLQIVYCASFSCSAFSTYLLPSLGLFSQSRSRILNQIDQWNRWKRMRPSKLIFYIGFHLSACGYMFVFLSESSSILSRLKKVSKMAKVKILNQICVKMLTTIIIDILRVLLLFFLFLLHSFSHALIW